MADLASIPEVGCYKVESQHEAFRFGFTADADQPETKPYKSAIDDGRKFINGHSKQVQRL